jgi:D-alanyl-lipoteichoic acid acyltransferase DltB (MBOAT superfamily)
LPVRAICELIEIRAMSFHSTVFLQFFGAFLLAYYLCRSSLPARNCLLVGASWLFYGWWDYRFLVLLIGSSCLDYAASRLLVITNGIRPRKAIVGLSIAANLTLLGFFKYYDFFVSSLAGLLATWHIPFRVETLGIILPVGISFYTFQSVGYVVDVYRRQLQPSSSLLNYLAFASFFPQLVAGPIQRGGDFLPQIERLLQITSTHLVTGFWLVLWGLFKKVVVADNMAPLVRMVFDDPSSGGVMIVSGALAFAVQIYGDFSGYSDIALGLAALLGFELKPNFRYPYFATDLRDFWRRWHISLSTWLRDYLYISLGGNRLGSARTALNVLVTMLLGGLWHGPSWNFVFWGLWHGIGLIITGWWQRHRAGRPPLSAWLAMPATFTFVLGGWLLFCAGSVTGVDRLAAALTQSSVPAWFAHYWLSLVAFATPLFLVDLWQFRFGGAALVLSAPAWVRHTVQGVFLLAIVLFWEKRSVTFIYFQF